MGLALWWYGPPSRTYDENREDGVVRTYELGGQTILLSHLEEIRTDFAVTCHEVVLFRLERGGGPPRIKVDDPGDTDDVVLERLVLVGYVSKFDQWGSIHFEFGSRRPGRLRWEPTRVDEAREQELADLTRRLDRGELESDAFEKERIAVVARADDQKRKLNTALAAARRRVVEAGHGRSASSLRRYQAAQTAVWVVLAGLLAWFCYSVWPTLPTMLVGAIALAAAGATTRPWLKGRFQEHGMDTYQEGPLRLNVNTRERWRQRRYDERQNLKIFLITAPISGAIGYLVGWLPNR